MKVLVTGAAGFIGSHVAEELLVRGHDVVALDDLSGGFADHVPAGATFVEGDILDEALLSELFETHNFDAVYHLAAYAAEGLSHFIRVYNYRVNIIGSMNLINLSILHKVKRFIFTSSIAVYGPNQVPMREDMTPTPEDPYGVAKLAVEQDLAAANRMFGLEYTIFRPHNVYGERQNLGDPYRNVVGIFMNKVMAGLTLPVFGDGTQTRAFSYIRDVAPAMVDALDNPKAINETFNVGGDNVYTVNDVAEVVQDAFGNQVGVEHLPPRQEVMHAYSDHSKAQTLLGVTGKTSLKDGIETMATWAQGVGVRKGKPFEHIEIRENLPPSWQALFAEEAIAVGSAAK